MESDKRGILLERLREDPTAPTIIYGTRQETAESLAAFLKREGIPARPYHAGLTAETRNACQEDFMSGKAPVITATIAFGMGIDKADIRRIIHYNLPKSLENYSQEIGRAGRDGHPATCELLACTDDLRILENFIYGDTPSPNAIRRVLDQILQSGDEFDLSLYELSGANDIRPLVINTLLTYLELDGYIAATSPFYTSYRIKFLRPIDQVLLGHDENRRKFLRDLFASGTEGRLWTTIDPADSAERLDTERRHVIKALTHLETHGDLALKPTGIRHGYRRLKLADDLSALTQRMQQLFEHREQQDLQRLQQVLAYAETTKCLNRQLLGHFGEAMAKDCGHCANCQRISQIAERQSRVANRKPERAAPVSRLPLPSTPTPTITEDALEIIQCLLREKHAPLRTPRQLARFLCGLRSPATTRMWYTPAGSKRRARLTSHDAFQLLEHHPFEDVLAHCQTLIYP